jgi:hypothetical protein
MTSAIDPTLPIFGFPTTQSVRNNFQTAHDEITALQAATAGGPFLPLIGGEITGQLQVDDNVRIGATVDAGFRLDVAGTGRINLPTAAIGVSPFLITNGAPAVPVAAIHPAALALLTNSGATGAAWQMLSFGNAGPTFVGSLARGSAGAPTAVTTDSALLGIWGSGFDGTGWAYGTNIFLRAAEPWTPTAHGSYLAFGGTSTGATALLEWMRLRNGNLLIGSTVDAGYRLDVTGTAHVLGAVTLDGAVQLNNAVTFGQNTVGAPVFINGPAATARFLRFNTAGVLRWQINENATAESGANAGSDLDITNYSDAGAPITNPLIRMMRATGNVSIGSGVDAGFRLDVVGTGRFSGLLTASVGAQVSGTLAVGTNTTGSPININGPVGSAARQLTFLTAGLSRWALRANQIAEGGGNVGSDLDFLAYDDTGAVLYNPAFRFARSTGLATYFFGLSLGSTLAPGGTTDLSRGLALFGTTSGFNVTTNRLNIVTPNTAVVVAGGTDVATFNSTGITANTVTQAQGVDNTSLANATFTVRIATGYNGVAISDADTVLTATQAGVPNLGISGTLTADRAVTLPSGGSQKNWFVGNNTAGGFNIIVGFGSGATFSIPPNFRMPLYWTTAQGQGMFNLVSPLLRVGDATRNGLLINTGIPSSSTIISLTGTGGLQFATMPLSFNNATPVAKQTITGAKGGNTALASVIALLVAYGLGADTTTA